MLQEDEIHCLQDKIAISSFSFTCARACYHQEYNMSKTKEDKQNNRLANN